MKACECGCMKLVKEGNRFIHGHSSIVWFKNHPEIKIKVGKKGGKIGGKRVHELYPDMAKSNGRKIVQWCKKYPVLASKAEKLGGKRAHELHPGLVCRMGKRSAQWTKKHPILASKRGRAAGKIGGPLAVESIRKNKPHIWYGVRFMSKNEMFCAKKILKRPVAGKNCHVKVGSKTIDFFPLRKDRLYKGKFVEYHPWDWAGRTQRQYQRDREEAIESSKFNGTELVVLTEIPS